MAELDGHGIAEKRLGHAAAWVMEESSASAPSRRTEGHRALGNLRPGNLRRDNLKTPAAPGKHGMAEIG
jgi:hypothetical protein